MPELPEIETLKCALSPDVTSLTISTLIVRCHALREPIDKELARRLRHKTVLAVSRRGKNLLFILDNNEVLLIHLGMSGRLRWVKKEAALEKHDHWDITFKNHPLILRYNDPRRFGLLMALPLSHLEARLKLGPEPLPELSYQALNILIPTAKITEKNTAPTDAKKWDGASVFKHSRTTTRSVKPWLLDGQKVAGVGNIYASEALYFAGIHPEKPMRSLTRQECHRLVKEVCAILMRAINAGGSTLRDYRQMSGQSGYFQFDFAVYDRAGQPCHRCAKAHAAKQSPEKNSAPPIIQRLMQSGRSTFFCPCCQH